MVRSLQFSSSMLVLSLAMGLASVAHAQSPATGCIQVFKETYDAQDGAILPVPAFTFTLDGTTTVTNNIQGHARFDNVPLGAHTVTETLPSGWSQILVTPTGGAVTVTDDTNCAGVVFKNRQAAASANVSITKTGATSVIRGNQMTYTLTVNNAGPDTAQNVIVTDPVPTGLTYNDAASDSACNQVGNNVVCEIGNGPANQNRTISLVFDVPTIANCSGTVSVTNTATVSSSTTDPVSNNNSSQTVTTEVQCPTPTTANLSITKTGPSTVVRGSTVSYTLTVNNAGPAVAQNVVVTDPIPSGLTFVSGASDQTCTQVGSNVVCTIGNGPAGQNRTINLTFNTPAADNSCSTTQINNVATVTSSTTDPVTSNNTSTTVTTQMTCPVAQMGCIDVTKQTYDTTGAVLTPVAQFTFTLDGTRTQHNTSDGRTRYENVTPGSHTVAEVLPTGWTQLSITPANGVVNVVAGTSCAQVTFSNKQSSLQPTLTIAKTDGRTQIAVNEIDTYTITLQNTSSNTAQGISVTDTLPSYLTYVSSSNGGTANGQIVTWTGLVIPANTSLTLTLQARVNANTPANTVLQNVTQIVGGPSATDTTTVIGGNTQGGLEITITEDDDPVELCEELEYEVTVRNLGSTQRNNIEVVLVLPDDVTFEDASNGGDEDDGTVTWDNLSLPANGTGKLHATITVDDDEWEDGDELTASAFTDGDSDEEDTEIDGDNCDNDDDDDGDVTVRKTASPSEVFPGGIVVYTITIENDSDEDMEDVEVEDRITGSQFSIVDDGDAESRSGNTIRWEFDSIDAGDTERITYRISVLPGAYPGEIIRNDVVVRTDDDDWRANAVVSVIGNLPQTGGRFFGGKGGSQFLSPFSGTLGSEDGSMPIIPLISIAGMVTGAGVTLGRKYFIGL